MPIAFVFWIRRPLLQLSINGAQPPQKKRFDELFYLNSDLLHDDQNSILGKAKKLENPNQVA
ncbi:MAG: hypothetical protein ACYDBJ_07685 [Aggregatilineales bacterium]